MPGAGAPQGPRRAVALKRLAPGMRRLLYTASVLVLLAGIQLFVFTGRTDSFFAFTVANPLAAAFLGAAYWAAVAIEALAGRQAVWANARIAVPAVLVFTILTLAVTLTHLGQLHLGGRFAVQWVLSWRPHPDRRRSLGKIRSSGRARGRSTRTP